MSLFANPSLRKKGETSLGTDNIGVLQLREGMDGGQTRFGNLREIESVGDSLKKIKSPLRNKKALNKTTGKKVLSKIEKAPKSDMGKSFRQ